MQRMYLLTENSVVDTFGSCTRTPFSLLDDALIGRTHERSSTLVYGRVWANGRPPRAHGTVPDRRRCWRSRCTRTVSRESGERPEPRLQRPSIATGTTGTVETSSNALDSLHSLPVFCSIGAQSRRIIETDIEESHASVSIESLSSLTTCPPESP